MSEKGYKNTIDYSVFGDLSMCYARIGDISKAYELLDKLSWHEVHNKIRKYHKSKLLVVEGNHDEAMDSLSVSIQLGYPFETYSFRFDNNLKPLFDNPRFQEMVKVKG